MTDKSSHPRVQIYEDDQDLPPEVVAELQAETGIADMHDERIQLRMMATAAFLLTTNTKIPLQQRADIANAWNVLLAADAERKAIERLGKVFDESEGAKKLPLEFVLALVHERTCDKTEKAWSILHNLVTVLNPDQDEHETDANGNPIRRKP